MPGAGPEGRHRQLNALKAGDSNLRELGGRTLLRGFAARSRQRKEGRPQRLTRAVSQPSRTPTRPTHPRREPRRGSRCDACAAALVAWGRGRVRRARRRSGFRLAKPSAQPDSTVSRPVRFPPDDGPCLLADRAIIKVDSVDFNTPVKRGQPLARSIRSLRAEVPQAAADVELRGRRRCSGVSDRPRSAPI